MGGRERRRYQRIDGSTISGPSPSDLVKAAAPETDKRMRAALDHALAKFTILVKRAETKETYDQMIAEGNEEGNIVVENAIDALLALTKEIERAIAVLKLKRIDFEGSNSLDSPDKVAQ